MEQIIKILISVILLSPVDKEATMYRNHLDKFNLGLLVL